MERICLGSSCKPSPRRIQHSECTHCDQWTHNCEHWEFYMPFPWLPENFDCFVYFKHIVHLTKFGGTYNNHPQYYNSIRIVCIIYLLLSEGSGWIIDVCFHSLAINQLLQEVETPWEGSPNLVLSFGTSVVLAFTLLHSSSALGGSRWLICGGLLGNSSITSRHIDSGGTVGHSNS